MLRNNQEEIHQFTRPGTPLWPHGPPLALSRFLVFNPSALPASGPLHGCAPPPNTPVRPNDRTSSRRLCLHPVPLQHRRGTHPFPEPPVSLPTPPSPSCLTELWVCLRSRCQTLPTAVPWQLGGLGQSCQREKGTSPSLCPFSLPPRAGKKSGPRMPSCETHKGKMGLRGVPKNTAGHAASLDCAPWGFSLRRQVNPYCSSHPSSGSCHLLLNTFHSVHVGSHQFAGNQFPCVWFIKGICFCTSKCNTYMRKDDSDSF